MSTFQGKSSIHMDNQTYLCPFNTKHSSIVCLTAFFEIILFLSLCLLHLLSHDSAGFLQTFRFSLFAFWWGDTRHVVESRHPGRILIEEKHKGASQRETRRPVQADSDRVRQRGVKMRDRHQKKYNERESEWDRWNKGRWKSKLKKRKEIVLGTLDPRKK